MKRFIKGSCVAAAILVALQFNACGGGTKSVPAAGVCSVSLSGGASGSYDCLSVLFFDSSANQLILSVSSTNGLFSAALTLGAQNSVRTGTISPSSTTQGYVSLKSGNNAAWVTSQHNSDPDQGTFSVDINAVGSQVALDAKTTVYAATQGKLTAKLEPQSSTAASGEVTATVTFTTGSTRPGGGTTPDAGNPDGGTTAASTCVITLGGDLQGKVDCTSFGYYDSAKNASSISFIGSARGFVLSDGGTADLSLLANVYPNSTGDLQAGTYTTANTSSASGSLLLNGGAGYGSSWDGNAANTRGTFSVTVSDVGPASPYTGGNKFWNSIHGTYTGTLASSSGAGTVTCDIKY